MPAIFVPDVSAIPKEGIQLVNKCLMICFDCCNKLMTGLKSSTRVGEEAVTERAWLALSQEDKVWKDIQGKGTPVCTKSQFRREYLIWEMTRAWHI